MVIVHVNVVAPGVTVTEVLYNVGLLINADELEVDQIPVPIVGLLPIKLTELLQVGIQFRHLPHQENC